MSLPIPEQAVRPIFIDAGMLQPPWADPMAVNSMSKFLVGMGLKAGSVQSEEDVGKLTESLEKGGKVHIDHEMSTFSGVKQASGQASKALGKRIDSVGEAIGDSAIGRNASLVGANMKDFAHKHAPKTPILKGFADRVSEVGKSANKYMKGGEEGLESEALGSQANELNKLHEKHTELTTKKQIADQRIEMHKAEHENISKQLENESLSSTEKAKLESQKETLNNRIENETEHSEALAEDIENSKSTIDEKQSDLNDNMEKHQNSVDKMGEGEEPMSEHTKTHQAQLQKKIDKIKEKNEMNDAVYKETNTEAAAAAEAPAPATEAPAAEAPAAEAPAAEAPAPATKEAAPTPEEAAHTDAVSEHQKATEEHAELTKQSEELKSEGDKLVRDADELNKAVGEHKEATEAHAKERDELLKKQAEFEKEKPPGLFAGPKERAEYKTRREEHQKNIKKHDAKARELNETRTELQERTGKHIMNVNEHETNLEEHNDKMDASTAKLDEAKVNVDTTAAAKEPVTEVQEQPPDVKEAQEDVEQKAAEKKKTEAEVETKQKEMDKVNTKNKHIQMKLDALNNKKLMTTRANRNFYRKQEKELKKQQKKLKKQQELLSQQHADAKSAAAAAATEAVDAEATYNKTIQDAAKNTTEASTTTSTAEAAKKELANKKTAMDNAKQLSEKANSKTKEIALANKKKHVADHQVELAELKLQEEKKKELEDPENANVTFAERQLEKAEKNQKDANEHIANANKGILTKNHAKQAAKIKEQHTAEGNNPEEIHQRRKKLEEIKNNHLSAYDDNDFKYVSDKELKTTIEKKKGYLADFEKKNEDIQNKDIEEERQKMEKDIEHHISIQSNRQEQAAKVPEKEKEAKEAAAAAKETYEQTKQEHTDAKESLKVAQDKANMVKKIKKQMSNDVESDKRAMDFLHERGRTSAKDRVSQLAQQQQAQQQQTQQQQTQQQQQKKREDTDSNTTTLQKSLENTKQNITNMAPNKEDLKKDALAKAKQNIKETESKTIKLIDDLKVAINNYKGNKNFENLRKIRRLYNELHEEEKKVISNHPLKVKINHILEQAGEILNSAGPKQSGGAKHSSDTKQVHNIEQLRSVIHDINRKLKLDLHEDDLKKTGLGYTKDCDLSDKSCKHPLMLFLQQLIDYFTNTNEGHLKNQNAKSKHEFHEKKLHETNLVLHSLHNKEQRKELHAIMVTLYTTLKNEVTAEKKHDVKDKIVALLKQGLHITDHIAKNLLKIYQELHKIDIKGHLTPKDDKEYYTNLLNIIVMPINPLVELAKLLHMYDDIKDELYDIMGYLKTHALTIVQEYNDLANKYESHKKTQEFIVKTLRRNYKEYKRSLSDPSIKSKEHKIINGIFDHFKINNPTDGGPWYYLTLGVNIELDCLLDNSKYVHLFSQILDFKTDSNLPMHHTITLLSTLLDHSENNKGIWSSYLLDIQKCIDIEHEAQQKLFKSVIDAYIKSTTISSDSLKAVSSEKKAVTHLKTQTIHYFKKIKTMLGINEKGVYSASIDYDLSMQTFFHIYSYMAYHVTSLYEQLEQLGLLEGKEKTGEYYTTLNELIELFSNYLNQFKLIIDNINKRFTIYHKLQLVHDDPHKLEQFANQFHQHDLKQKGGSNSIEYQLLDDINSSKEMLKEIENKENELRKMRGGLRRKRTYTRKQHGGTGRLSSTLKQGAMHSYNKDNKEKSQDGGSIEHFANMAQVESEIATEKYKTFKQMESAYTKLLKYKEEELNKQSRSCIKKWLSKDDTLNCENECLRKLQNNNTGSKIRCACKQMPKPFNYKNC